MTTITGQPQATLKPGAVVCCRTRRYLVEDVQAPPESGGDTLVSMACMKFVRGVPFNPGDPDRPEFRIKRPEGDHLVLAQFLGA